jgi:formylglycine-generating enzyme required for sulfatase activity
MARSRYNHGFRWDLFVSYSHDDNAAPENWVEAFEERLKIRLKEIGGNAVEIWRDTRRMGSGAVLEPAVMEAVADSAIFLMILSPNWKASDWCPREREVFESTGCALSVANRSRVMVAERYPADPYPAGVMETFITQFFGRKADGTPQHFAVPAKPAHGEPFEDPFALLAGNIAATLRELEKNPVRIKEAGEKDPSKLGAGPPLSDWTGRRSAALLPMGHVFLSYKTEDRSRVDAYRQALEAAGIEVWWDVKVGIGERWRDEILIRVESAACVLVCWSHGAVTSDWVKEEATKAKARGTYLPIRIDVGVEIPFGLAEEQTPQQPSVAAIVEAVRERLRPKSLVFVCSTVGDLLPYRDQVKSAARSFGFEAVFSDGKSAKLSAVANASFVILMSAHRYGDVVRQEYEHARSLSKPVHAFVMDPTYAWPDQFKEKHDLEKALELDDPREFIATVKRNIESLKQFQAGLTDAKLFADTAGFRAALIDIFQKQHLQPGAADDAVYLQYLEDDTRQIRIRGLKSKRAEPYFFGIDEIYIPLTTASGYGGRTNLEKTIRDRRLVLIGEPGAGKSTFLRRVAFELCRNLRGTRFAGAPPFLDAKDRRFPILIRIGDFANYVAESNSARAANAADWLPAFLAQQSQDFKWRLNYEFFERKLIEGGCLVLIDGLDESPSAQLRNRISRIFEAATSAFNKSDFLVTTRPQSYEGDAELKDFQKISIGAVENQEIQVFLGHFAKALALNDAESAKFQQQLGDALSHRLEIREMAANPVMLTALAVLQHNDHKLPEHRVQLYESILSWLALARESMTNRNAERCIEVMRRLALHMQDAPQGRIVQINRRLAAEYLSQQFGGGIEETERMLNDETENSGIISPVGPDLKFWHLSFQEYLAAREISSLTDDKQFALVDSKLYRAEWRETMRLLGAILREQGVAKIEGLVKAILATVKPEDPLPKKAPVVALLGAMMRDLSKMDYEPKTPDYKTTVRAVMSIFEPGESQKLPFHLRLEAADALGQVGDPRLDEDNWIVIPSGEFWMGAQQRQGRNHDPSALGSESPVHKVWLAAFRIRRYPVTVQEYARFIEHKGYATERYWRMGGFGQFQYPEDWAAQQKYPNRPVVSVSWFEASAYCEWFGSRLPKEAEWERVARGAQSARYPWGDQPKLSGFHANYDSKPGYPTPVGLYPLGNSQEGLSDLLGNVWEWTSDWFGDAYHQQSLTVGPTGPDITLACKVVRGSSWENAEPSVRASSRSKYRPVLRIRRIGFRCAGELG